MSQKNFKDLDAWIKKNPQTDKFGNVYVMRWLIQLEWVRQKYGKEMAKAFEEKSIRNAIERKASLLKK